MSTKGQGACLLGACTTSGSQGQLSSPPGRNSMAPAPNNRHTNTNAATTTHLPLLRNTSNTAHQAHTAAKLTTCDLVAAMHGNGMQVALATRSTRSHTHTLDFGTNNTMVHTPTLCNNASAHRFNMTSYPYHTTLHPTYTGSRHCWVHLLPRAHH